MCGVGGSTYLHKSTRLMKIWKSFGTDGYSPDTGSEFVVGGLESSADSTASDYTVKTIFIHKYKDKTMQVTTKR